MSTFRIEQLSAAFAYDIVRAIVAADEKLVRSELGVLKERCDALIEAGLMAADGTLLSDYEVALTQAHTHLAEGLGQLAKLELLELFRQAQAVDGELDEREGSIVREAAALLGLPA